MRPLLTRCERFIQEFHTVFSMPEGLPPHRAREHCIVLREGASLPNTRPYGYPQVQKAEIERLVTDMMASGIIRPSNSPYASPVLLV